MIPTVDGMGETRRLTILVRRGAAVLATAGLALVALDGAAAAATPAPLTQTTVGAASPVTGLGPVVDESWFVDPLTTRQRAREIAVPSHPSRYNGKALRWTRARLRTADGSLAVPARMAVGHTLVAGQALTLSARGLFTMHRVALTPYARRLLTRLAPSLDLTTSVRCEGYSDFGSNRPRSSTPLSRARARALCRAVEKVAPHATATPVAVGNRRPAVVGSRTLARQENRRVVLVVTGSSGEPTGTVPGVPEVSVVTAGNASINLEFGPPLDDGGRPVTTYQASLDGGSWFDLVLLSEDPHTAVIPGLTNGHTYSVRVRAVNGVGASAASAPVSVTPSVCAGVPGFAPIASVC